MRIRVLLFALLLSIGKFANAQESNIVPGNLLVMFDSDEAAKNLLKQLRYLGEQQTALEVEQVLSKSMHIYLFDFNASVINQDQILAAVRSNPHVKAAQFNYILKERILPNDTKFSVMWDMNNTGQSGGTADADIDAAEAWDITTGGLTSEGDTIVVAVIDGGYDLAQQDLNFWKNYKEIANNNIDDDNNGYIDDRDGWNGVTATDNFSVASHGTHVCGTIGAKGNNGIGVTGVNWNVKVMPLSYGSGGSTLESGAVAAYAYVRDQRELYNQTNGAKGAFVVSTNSSFGIDLAQPSAHQIWCVMFDSLGAVGVLSAAATTNAETDVDAQGDIPTACTSNWMIAVTNTDRMDNKATAGYGTTTIDLGAPGSSITSTYPSNTYSSISGTSMATPHVAGAIALMYSVPCAPLISNYKTDPAGVALIIKDSLLNATDPISSLSGITVTGGRLNLYKAVKSAQNYCIDVSVANNEPLDYPFEIKNVYPNPTTNFINIAYSSDAASDISIVNVLGEEVKRIQCGNTKGLQHLTIDMAALNKGMYFVTILSNNKRSNVVKVLIY